MTEKQPNVRQAKCPTLGRQIRGSPFPRELPTGLLIDGSWRPSSNAGTFEVIDPATEEVFATAVSASAGDIDEALASAQRGWSAWRNVDAWTRSAALRRVAEIIRDWSAQMALVLTSEQGKPLAGGPKRDPRRRRPVRLVCGRGAASVRAHGGRAQQAAADHSCAENQSDRLSPSLRGIFPLFCPPARWRPHWPQVALSSSCHPRRPRSRRPCWLRPARSGRAPERDRAARR